jgi:hypothetical protein
MAVTALRRLSFVSVGIQLQFELCCSWFEIFCSELQANHRTRRLELLALPGREVPCLVHRKAVSGIGSPGYLHASGFLALNWRHAGSIGGRYPGIGGRHHELTFLVSVTAHAGSFLPDRPLSGQAQLGLTRRHTVFESPFTE